MIQINIQEFLSIQNVFFTVLGYEMSYIEFFGTILNIVSVYLVAKNKILNWPIGIIASILFMFLFWQIQLYSDFAEQIYFIITGFWGWLAWISGNTNKIENKFSKITTLKNKEKAFFGGVAVVGTLCLGLLMSQIHNLLPGLFIGEASYPYLDAFTTVLSFIATYFLIIKKLESWYLWIIVDIIGIWLYYVKEVKFIALLYLIFLVLATNGLISWLKIYKSKKQNVYKV